MVQAHWHVSQHTPDSMLGAKIMLEKIQIHTHILCTLIFDLLNGLVVIKNTNMIFLIYHAKHTAVFYHLLQK